MAEDLAATRAGAAVICSRLFEIRRTPLALPSQGRGSGSPKARQTKRIVGYSTFVIRRHLRRAREQWGSEGTVAVALLVQYDRALARCGDKLFLPNRH